jgi:hypothetical protein
MIISKLKIILCKTACRMVSAENIFVIIFNTKYKVITSTLIKITSKLKINLYKTACRLVSAEIYLLLKLPRIL